MGPIGVREFITLDGVIEAPPWTFDYPFDPKKEDALAATMVGSQGIMLGRTTPGAGRATPNAHAIASADRRIARDAPDPTAHPGSRGSPTRRRARPERTHAMSVTLNAYLFFPGNTEEAIAFYQEVFGGHTTITRRGDVDPTASDTEKNQVINALLTGGDITLRASDRDDATLDPQTRVELSIIGTDEPRLRTVFDGLAKGGAVKTPLAKQFWGDVFGAVIDKYGIGWQVNVGAAGA